MNRPKDMSDWDWGNKCAAIRSNQNRVRKAKSAKKSEAKRIKQRVLQRKIMDGTQDVVYVIGWSEGGPMKVGVTDKIDQRVSQLQTGNPYKLKVFHEVPCDSRSQATDIESWTHARLVGFRMTGEWFDISALECINSIRIVADAVRLKSEPSSA